MERKNQKILAPQIFEDGFMQGLLSAVDESNLKTVRNSTNQDSTDQDSTNENSTNENSTNINSTKKIQVDMFVQEDSYLLRMDLPGVFLEDITIKIKNNILSISGERRKSIYATGSKCILNERENGKFRRSFRLSDAINHQEMAATLSDGVLEIYLPKIILPPMNSDILD